MANQKLNIDKRLPQIVVPNNKLQMFIDWYNTDLINETEIPVVFNEGYLKLDLEGILKCKIPSIFEINNELEYEMYKHVYNEIMRLYSKVIAHYNINDNDLRLTIYDTNNNVMFTDKIDLMLRKLQLSMILMEKDTDKKFVDKLNEQLEVKPLEIDFSKIMKELSANGLKTQEIMDKVFGEYIGKLFRRLVFGIIVSSFWYLTTIKSKAKEKLLYTSVEDVYINKKHHNNYRHNDTIRNITTPIYNFKFVKNTTTEKLSTKHSSWKISYAFPVRGHYRHYKSGKVIFIKSYEKGTGKDIKQTQLKLNPKSLI